MRFTFTLLKIQKPQEICSHFSLTVLAVFLIDQLGARKYSHAFSDQN